MAVGSFPFPKMHPVKGLRLGSVSANIRYTDRDDLLLIELGPNSSVAGVFTQNAFCAAPVTVCKSHLPGNIRYLLVNSGNANACTGQQGLTDALASCAKVAELSGTQTEQVLPFSTGVIGELLPMDNLLEGIPAAIDALDDDGWKAAARAIMTTDTRPKGASEQLEIGGHTITVSGIAKGSGMIKPDMATMLAYIATDADVCDKVLQDMVGRAADASFNRITVDGDTSTNDSCMLMATGTADLAHIDDAGSAEAKALYQVIENVLIDLAKSIVSDGEGATKFISIEVAGGGTQQECLDVAYSVAQSPLVKTALFASDPNWGRIVAAIGYAGVDGLDDTQVTVHLDDVLIVEKGGRAESYTEAAGQKVMDQESITIRIHLNRGDHSETVWTTDLSHDYVTINADYRS
ncbi:bifunctional glutamate N-acetyltransferase/amino-acid acetyltransferase ArgJ [Pseudoteredinibacter isoporae]|uniref:Arginine biosynthesis bifunctional protein ArgJ n=1 Tax=Pseudoteredinibacter isoporae TaxID=570281 RepID=A0A7X0JVS9_9GAMM|nr:bifunctional glutamate N-acetyltransferase/amino-acid acetyltransferase ArgJ [Pseudoteredinibacter isoporae]MBB6522719.1 glutamate N-acetyltransferase/amino-acid N-acetyltransferase [Pseudoteredinibacter isoporae]NHO88249.1 bifunctional glutamate N-acetyltransferase/amino-acid acetyltransferase ArgJ [Pseudoteredinibacter isoporae]NIB23420.1 bifunctional glutamate N-acetyltransferase/amino-acid acetyltransferase ArgJ [Pseudoteredinibacter isoporae]